MGKKIKRPQKGDIVEYYINQLHTREQSASFFGTSLSTFGRWLVEYDILKDADTIRKTIESENMAKYGKPHYTSEETIRKTKETCLRKYGVDNPSKDPSIIRKIVEKESIPVPPYDDLYRYYITENHSWVECASHYGVSSSVIGKWVSGYGISKDPAMVSAKRSITNMAKYGAVTPLLNDDIKKRIEKSNTEKYGVRNVTQRNIQHFDEWDNSELFVSLMERWDGRPTVYKLSQYFNVGYSGILKQIHRFKCENLVDIKPLRSHYEDEIVGFIRSLGISNIVMNDRTVLDGREIDIYLPDHRVGIEFDGEYYHCDLQEKYQDHNGRSTRHQEKSLLAESKGVFLFHILEHEWSTDFTNKNPKFANSRENIMNRLSTILQSNHIRIPARKCVVREVPRLERDRFLDENHIQGSEHHSSRCLGLYLDDRLVGCMTFGRSRYGRYDWELSRFCSLRGTNIMGGASKLFSHFVRETMSKGETIVSYSDITKANGKLYDTLGFSCVSVNQPNYWWVNLDTYDVRSRYVEQAAGEVERMHGLGYHRICDCGTKTWLYTKI